MSCLRHTIFNVCNHKHLLWPIWNRTFGKNIFIFWYSYMITSLIFRTFPIIFFIKVIIYAWICINRLQFNGSLYVLLYLLIMSPNLSIYKLFDMEVMYLWILFFKVLINFSAATDFLHYVLNTFYFATMISLICYKIHCYYPMPLSTLIWFGLGLDSSKIFWTALVIAIPFSGFKGVIHAYLLKISITYNKKRILLLDLLINWISARSAPQILSIKGQYAFRFLNFLIIGLCNSSPNSWFDIFSFLTASAGISFMKTFINHWSKLTLIPIIFWIFGNIKCFVT